MPKARKASLNVRYTASVHMRARSCVCMVVCGSLPVSVSVSLWRSREEMKVCYLQIKGLFASS